MKAVGITQLDVAERAGVNQSVVSRVLARDPEIATETADRVWCEIARALRSVIALALLLFATGCAATAPPPTIVHADGTTYLLTASSTQARQLCESLGVTWEQAGPGRGCYLGTPRAVNGHLIVCPVHDDACLIHEHEHRRAGDFH